MSIRTVIADDQGMVRSGLRSLLQSEADIEVVAEAADGEQALAAIRRYRPDVALMDIRMPNMDGLAATRRLTEEEVATRILILTTYDLDEYVFDALRAGASGFMLKDAPADDLIAGIRTVARGDSLLAPAVTRRVVEAFVSIPTADQELSEAVAGLSDREREVLRLLACGYSNREIADKLVVSAATVKTHVSNVLSKLRLRDRVQAVVVAYESGLVRPSGHAPR